MPDIYKLMELEAEVKKLGNMIANGIFVASKRLVAEAIREVEKDKLSKALKLIKVAQEFALKEKNVLSKTNELDLKLKSFFGKPTKLKEIISKYIEVGELNKAEEIVKEIENLLNKEKKEKLIALLYSQYIIDLTDKEISEILTVDRRVKFRVLKEKPDMLKGRIWSMINFDDAKELIKYGSFVTAECVIWTLIKHLIGELSTKQFKEILSSKNLPFDPQPIISVIKSREKEKIIQKIKSTGILEVAKPALENMAATSNPKIKTTATKLLKYLQH